VKQAKTSREGTNVIMSSPLDTLRLFFRASDLREELLEDGVKRVIYTGVNLQVVEYHFPARRSFPAHNHPAHEQMGYLVSGRMGFRVGDEERTLEPGDYYHAPIGVMHHAWTLDEPSVLVDFFSPPREDLMVR
jgi:quercetin dioxygenase-like cupin family protein